MKKILLLLLLTLQGMPQLMAAQEYEYVPFVREGVKWVYEYTFRDSSFEPTEVGSTWLTLEIKGDTVINGKTYKAMHKYHGDAINVENDTIPVYLREENKVVYGIVPDGKTYRDCPIGIAQNVTLHNQIINGEEFVLYDFLDPITFWAENAPISEEEKDEIGLADTIQIGSHWAKRYKIERYIDSYVVEGIGHDRWGCNFILFPYKPYYVGSGHDYFHFSHVIEDGEIIYKSVNYRDPQTNDDYEYVPFVREGVKWVYRYNNPFGRDVLDMDEGIQYYSFEMKGDVLIGDKYYKPVILTHYLDNNTKEVEDFIPVYLREENKVVYAIIPDGIVHPQCPVGYDWYVGAPGSLPIYTSNEEFVLYDFNNMRTFYNNLHSGQIYYNGWAMMNIGSHKSKDYHYDTWYGGDEMIIESIGYAGIAGTPLFYFGLSTTDSQVEYGLSHVIENDQIVYKGQWYNPDITLGIDEVVVDVPQRVLDGNYYNLMGQPVGKEVPTTPGIYIHQGKKILVR